ncbi:hypothetical protein BZA05DRAFT_390586 [Tricharina praecox]|uniref:uncharacterized protein n=1 Tax=Tricharina praecox TaxID=43433 RepID=UPI00221FBD56|nr:uncharacterized protein BZA05DRAFT_390586 [Tricharina praecox]KAI5856082.1 hypothetical protein BZA05DRAFT_390586 [Tricharina praecox]
MPSSDAAKKAPFSIIIVGAGLGGLATAVALRKKGHAVHVLEGASELKEVGAGIQIPPNSSRLLQSWGLKEQLLKKVVWPKNINMRRYQDGDVIGVTPLDPKMTKTYGYPYWLIHRADYQRMLHDAALAEGATITLGAYVQDVDQENVTVTLHDGTVLKADVIIGADGIRSRVRECAVVTEETVEPRTTTNCAYRATVPGEIMRADPEVRHLMDEASSNCWIGYRRHIMAYPIQEGKLYNLVMSHPGKAAVGKWNEPGNLDEMKAQYKGWDPVICKVLEKVEYCLKWTLADLPVLPRWVSKSGRVVLIGDAAHAMVPYLAQGAGQAIEDGASLAECISRARDSSDLPAVLAAFQTIRKPRCEKIQKGSMENGDIWHMPDGPEQLARDADMKMEMGATDEDRVAAQLKQQKLVKSNPNRWSDPEFQPWLFGHDAIAHANTQLDLILKF